MADDLTRNPVAGAGRDVLPTAQPGVLDANGFDPTEFEWRPVPRRPRKDGWTPEVQQQFILALARTGVVEQACEEVDRSVRSAYDLRNAPGGQRFARAWRDVLACAADRALDIAFEHATLGEEIPIFDQDGVRTGATRRYNTRMAMFLLRAYHPDRFRFARKDHRDQDEPTTPPVRTVADIVARLAPVTPAAPDLLAAPNQLKTMVRAAEAEADREEARTPDDAGGYRHPRIPDNHPNVALRAPRTRAARDRREEREKERDRP